MDPFNVCVPVLHAFMINGNKVTVFLCVNVNDGNRKEEASEKKRYLRVMLGLYKILAHYLINSILDDDQVV